MHLTWDMQSKHCFKGTWNDSSLGGYVNNLIYGYINLVYFWAIWGEAAL